VALEPEDRAKLRQFLVERFSLDELKNLAFDLGVDFELFAHQTKQEFSRGLIAYFERRDNLSCLVTELLRQRHDDDLAQLLAKLPARAANKKIQIIASEDVLQDVSVLLDELAKKLGISRHEVALVGAAWGSARLLISVPEDAIDRQVLSELRGLGEGEYEVAAVDTFDGLDTTSQEAWRLVARDWPPILRENVLRPAISWQEALAALKAAPFAAGRALLGRLRPWLWGIGVAGGLVIVGLVVRQTFFQGAATPTPTMTASPMPTPTATVAATLTPIPATPTPSPTSSASPSPTASSTPSPTITPSPTASHTPTPSVTPSATASHTPTPSATPSQTPVPAAVTPELIEPALGATYQNPITFRWKGLLIPGETYQVTAYHRESGRTIQSALLTTELWVTKLPPDQFGQWHWGVAVVRYGDVVAESAGGMFWFNPFPKEPPIITFTPTPTPAMATPTAWVPVPSPTWPVTPLAKMSDAASVSLYGRQN
jgi:hypothetical protein